MTREFCDSCGRDITNESFVIERAVSLSRKWSVCSDNYVLCNNCWKKVTNFCKRHRDELIEKEKEKVLNE